MREALYCGWCSLDVSEPDTETIPLLNGGFHIKATCPKCHGFLKFLPTGTPRKLYFGKYNGELIADIAKNDLPYLKWLLERQDLKPKLRREIEEAIGGKT
jgi:hypothetical protein